MYEFYDEKRKFLHTYPPMKMDRQSVQTPGNYPEASTQHSKHSGHFQSRTKKIICSTGYLTAAS